VTEFPLVGRDAEGGAWYPMNHPFTSPRPEDLIRLESDPGSVRALAYDVVCNGWELGSGSIRIHRADVQERVFRLLGISEEEGRERFGFLLEAFRYGAPPHGGIALGLDRICALAAGASSLREIIAFPKTTSGLDLMMRAPSEVPDDQVKALHISLERPQRT
jgi:aspartyl-tRNA synthetase